MASCPLQEEVAGLRDSVAQRMRELEAVVDAKVAELSESSNKNVQLGARVSMAMIMIMIMILQCLAGQLVVGSSVDDSS